MCGRRGVTFACPERGGKWRVTEAEQCYKLSMEASHSPTEAAALSDQAPVRRQPPLCKGTTVLGKACSGTGKGPREAPASHRMPKRAEADCCGILRPLTTSWP